MIFFLLDSVWAADLPDLAPVSLQVPEVLAGPPNLDVTLVWGVTNQGIGAAEGGWSDDVYLSTNAVMDEAAKYVRGWYQSGPIPAGGSFWRTNTVQLPVVASGTYYLLFQTDISNSILESDENNNVMAVPFTFNSTPPDLVPVSLRVAWVLTGPPNLEVTLVWGVTNQGIGPAVREWGWSDRVSVHQRGVGWDGEFC